MGTQHQSAPPPRLRINWNLVITITVMLLSWVWGAASGAWQFNDRVTKLETLRQGDERRLERIEYKVDRLLERRP
jgi:hypothetical protein